MSDPHLIMEHLRFRERVAKLVLPAKLAKLVVVRVRGSVPPAAMLHVAAEIVVGVFKLVLILRVAAPQTVTQCQVGGEVHNGQRWDMDARSCPTCFHTVWLTHCTTAESLEVHSNSLLWPQKVTVRSGCMNATGSGSVFQRLYRIPCLPLYA